MNDISPQLTPFNAENYKQALYQAVRHGIWKKCLCVCVCVSVCVCVCVCAHVRIGEKDCCVSLVCK